MDRNHWKLGDTSGLFESQGEAGTIARTAGDHGGASYGIYQMSSAMGTAKEFVTSSRYAEAFKDLKPGSEAFDDAWTKVARDHADFGDEQHSYIRKSHVDPVTESLTRRGIDFHDRGPAVQDMVWSMSVQYRNRTAGMVERGIREAYGESADLTALSDGDIVRAVQRTKLVHVHDDFRSSTDRVREGVETRVQAEERALIRLAETGSLGSEQQTNADWREASPVRAGSPSASVMALQEDLAELGVLNAHGERLTPDGDFGPSTQSAVRTFQASVGLPATGNAGALTRYRLNEQLATREVVHERTTSPSASLVCRLDDAAHPDNALFRQTRDHVRRLDETLGRTPDQHTDNIASALVVQARADGLQRIDQIALSPDGTKLWGVQTPPGRRDHLFDLQTHVPTAESMTSMDQSAARWPVAIQQFEQHEQQRAINQQQSQERAQAESQQAPMSGPAMTR